MNKHVLCVSKGAQHFITVGKIYQLIPLPDSYGGYRIVNDDKAEHTYEVQRFIELEDTKLLRLLFE
jgi:hypothetical protein